LKWWIQDGCCEFSAHDACFPRFFAVVVFRLFYFFFVCFTRSLQIHRHSKFQLLKFFLCLFLPPSFRCTSRDFDIARSKLQKFAQGQRDDITDAELWHAQTMLAGEPTV
jgi:hypothetical protein